MYKIDTPPLPGGPAPAEEFPTYGTYERNAVIYSTVFTGVQNKDHVILRHQREEVPVETAVLIKKPFTWAEWDESHGKLNMGLEIKFVTTPLSKNKEPITQTAVLSVSGIESGNFDGIFSVSGTLDGHVSKSGWDNMMQLFGHFAAQHAEVDFEKVARAVKEIVHAYFKNIAVMRELVRFKIDHMAASSEVKLAQDLKYRAGLTERFHGFAPRWIPRPTSPQTPEP